MQRCVSFVALALAVAACGDNNNLSSPDASGDQPDAGPHVVAPRALAVAGDFGSPGVGTVAKLEIDELRMTLNVSGGAALGDPVIRYIDGKVYVINRFGSNNVTILDGKTLKVIDQISTGTNSNPQDVAVVGGKLYVPAAGTKGVIVLTPGTNTKTEIDLTSLDSVAPNDMQPDCISAFAVGTKVYVACGLLDSFAAVEPGKVAIIDTATDTMTGSVTLPDMNPFGFFARSPESSTFGGDLLIPLIPDFATGLTGCVARVSTGATPTASCAITNHDMGGFAAKVEVAPDGETLWLAVQTPPFATLVGKLRGVDLETGMVWPGAISTADQLISDVAACPGGQVVAMDATFGASGMRVWKDLQERTTSVKPIGMSPTSTGLICYDP